VGRTSARRSQSAEPVRPGNISEGRGHRHRQPTRPLVRQRRVCTLKKLGPMPVRTPAKSAIEFPLASCMGVAPACSLDLTMAVVTTPLTSSNLTP